MCFSNHKKVTKAAAIWCFWITASQKNSYWEIGWFSITEIKPTAGIGCRSNYQKLCWKDRNFHNFQIGVQAQWSGALEKTVFAWKKRSHFCSAIALTEKPTHRMQLSLFLCQTPSRFPALLNPQKTFSPCKRRFRWFGAFQNIQQPNTKRELNQTPTWEGASELK